MCSKNVGRELVVNHSPIHRFGKVLNLVLAFFVQRHPFAPQMEMLKSDDGTFFSNFPKLVVDLP